MDARVGGQGDGLQLTLDLVLGTSLDLGDRIDFHLPRSSNLQVWLLDTPCSLIEVLL